MQAGFKLRGHRRRQKPSFESVSVYTERQLKAFIGMRIGVVGINHKLANVHLREALAKACQRRFNPERSLHGQHVFLPLLTCNRTEIYFSSDNLSDTHTYLLTILRNEVEEDFDQKLYSFFGGDCLHHLCRVAAGLDSAILAETEIQGQVKTAYEACMKWIYLPSELHFLFQKALTIGKKIRTLLPVEKDIPDLEHAILHVGSKTLTNHLESNVLLLGTSTINLKTGQFLKSRGIKNITVCNRTNEKAEHFSQKFSFKWIPWSERLSWVEYDWIVVGTKSHDHLLDPSHLKKDLPAKKLLLDLAVPRNISPDLAKMSNIHLMNLDEINQLLKERAPLLQTQVEKAEEKLQALSFNLFKQFSSRQERKEKYLTNEVSKKACCTL